ncbi:MAG: hypothetical protein R6U43_05355 [Candidatus Krumholzibacteriales bacterium]
MVLKSGDIKADIAVIFGSGLSVSSGIGSFRTIADYDDVKQLPVPSVPGHPGRIDYFRSGNGTGMLLFMGRSHLYEGINFRRAGATVRTAAAMGCRKVLITNAAGCLVPGIPMGSWLAPGSVAALPIRRRAAGGQENFRYRFGRKGGVCRRFRGLVIDSALKAGLRVFTGNLFWNSGPCYETPAEARACRIMGADAVTMSVMPELTAAGELGLDAAVLSCMTNYTPNISGPGQSHTGVVDKCNTERAGLLELLRYLSEEGSRDG